MPSTVQLELFEQYRANLNNILEAIDSMTGPVICVSDALEFLTNIGILSASRGVEISDRCRSCSSNKDQLKTFIRIIYEPGNLDFVLYILDLLNLSDLALTVVRPVYAQRPIRRTELEHSRHLQTYFFQLKSNLDENTPFDREEFLKSQTNSILQSFSCNDSNDLSKAANRLAVVTWLRIQHCRRDTGLIRSVLSDMAKYWPNAVNNTLCDIVYHSKMGIAAIMDGDITSAMDHYRIAKHAGTSVHDPLTKVLLCHDGRYTNQRIFELGGSEENRKAILTETEIGLCFLESDSNGCDSFSLLMKRMFFLYIAMFRLKINNDLRTNESDIVCPEDIKASKYVLDCLERTLRPDETLDPRRGMIYLVCKARLLEQEMRLGVAEELLSKAFDLSEDGAFYVNEAKNIRSFITRLKLRE